MIPAVFTRPEWEVADVIQRYGEAFLHKHGGHLARVQKRALCDLRRCRTAELGGHVDACLDCGHLRIAYNSCRNRHCPKCQAQTRARWLDQQAAHLLPVEYFHVVFTLPREIAEMALQSGRALRSAVPGRVGHFARCGREPQTPRGPGRRATGAAYLGPESTPSSARPCRRHRWRPVVQSERSC